MVEGEGCEPSSRHVVRSQLSSAPVELSNVGAAPTSLQPTTYGVAPTAPLASRAANRTRPSASTGRAAGVSMTDLVAAAVEGCTGAREVAR